tara:strand:- start:2056 stop:2667 length:612 start_codon:yes stop_codon:yes gene_type:complete
MEIAIAYYSDNGQIKRIVESIKQYIVSLGVHQNNIHEIDICDEYAFKDLSHKTDHLIIGCPFYFGRIPKKMKDWIERNKLHLAGKDVSVFKVSLTEDSSLKEGKKNDLQNFLSKNLSATPKLQVSFISDLRFGRYGKFLNFLLDTTRRSGGSVNDHYTDYEAENRNRVKEFVEGIWKQLHRSRFEKTRSYGPTFEFREDFTPN